MLNKIKNFKNEKEAELALLGDYKIINSLLDNDLYKFTMQQYAFHNQLKSRVKYRFKCRSKVNLLKLRAMLENQIKHYCDLKLTQDEYLYMCKNDVFSLDYLEFLKGLKHDYNDVNIFVENDDLMIEIDGFWVNTILMEVPFLAIINGINSIMEASSKEGVHHYVKNGLKKLDEKIHKIKSSKSDLKIVEFGVRRRFYGYEYQKLLNQKMLKEIPNNYLGASNVKLGMDLNVQVYGTMAHEYLQAAQAISNPFDSQVFAFTDWLREYRGKLAIALSDIYGDEAFFVDFNKELAEKYDGLRQDSGDPIEWGYKVLNFYSKMDIDPSSKTIMFSDGLNIDKAIKINNEFKDKINVVFGIGTDLTNDTGIKALSIVIKMIEFNGKPVAKVSNDLSKSMCQDKKYLEGLFEIIHKKAEKYKVLFA